MTFRRTLDKNLRNTLIEGTGPVGPAILHFSKKVEAWVEHRITYKDTFGHPGHTPVRMLEVMLENREDRDALQ